MRIKIQIRMERANALRLALAFLRNAHTNRSTRLIPGIRSRNSVRKSWRFQRPLAFCHPADIRLLQPLFRLSFFCCSNLRLWLRGAGSASAVELGSFEEA